MRTIKLASALITLLALTAFAAATANATEKLWQWLPGTTGTTFTGKSSTATLQEKGGGSIKCASSTSTGVITAEQTLGLATITFKGCKAEGVAATNSLGDASETILTHVELHNCVISSGHAGILFKPLTPLHLEIPLISGLRLIAGSFVAEITPDKKAAKEFALNIKQTTEKSGEQAIEKCEGGSVETLTSESNENGTPVQSAEEVKEGTVTFKENEEAMA